MGHYGGTNAQTTVTTTSPLLKGAIPELALIRSLQFQGEGYDPDIDGVILVLDPGNDPP